VPKYNDYNIGTNLSIEIYSPGR